jgi:multidrug efflux system membrane fusion protein
LWPNAFVKARLLLETRKGVLVVPATAAQRGPQGTFVYLVAPDKTVSSRPIELESTEGDQAIVAKGLAPGDQVVTDGQNQLRPGAKVAPRP